MKRRRGVSGKFLGGNEVEAAAQPVAAEAEEKKPRPMPPAPRPKYCRLYTRARVAEALPKILDRFLTEAEAGSVPHTKMLSGWAGLDDGEVEPPVTKRPGKSMATLLLEEWNNGAGRIEDSTEVSAELGSDAAQMGEESYGI